MNNKKEATSSPEGAIQQSRAAHSVLNRLAVILLLIATTGCASSRAADVSRSDYDPFEPINRKVFAFNQIADRRVIRPIARGYDKLMPRVVKKGVSNFFGNLWTPSSAVNHLLQGDPNEAARQTGRFLVNSTFGVAGLFDPASRNGLVEKSANFNQTFGKWGIPSGPYFVVPILGPHTPRSGLGLYARYHTSLINYALEDNSSVRDKVWALQFIDIRYRLLRLDRMLDDAPDPYILTREAYRQRVEFEIHGEISLDDDFEFDDGPG